MGIQQGYHQNRGPVKHCCKILIFKAAMQRSDSFIFSLFNLKSFKSACSVSGMMLLIVLCCLTAKGQGIQGNPANLQRISSLKQRSLDYAAANDVKNFRSNFAEALKLAALSGDRGLFNDTRLDYANSLTGMSLNREAKDVLESLVPEGGFTSDDRIHILCLLIINSVKLGASQQLDTYYSNLQELLEQSATYNRQEYFLADAMYRQAKQKYLASRSVYRKLIAGFKPDTRVNKLSLEGMIYLADLYSKQLLKDSADHYFNRASAIVAPLERFDPLKVTWSRLYYRHRQQYKEAVKADNEVLKEVMAKDSLYRKELLTATKDLTAKYTIQKGEQDLKLLRKQQEVDALKYSRNRQRNLAAIGGLILSLLLLAGIGYGVVQRKKRAVEAKNNELQRIKLAHRTEVVRVLATGQEEERRRIADKLHDEVGSMLTVARLNLSADPGNRQQPGESQIRTADKILGDVATTIREMSHQLMPVAIRQYGLKQALEQLVSDINTSGKLTMEYLITGLQDSSRYPENFQVDLYRIIQELLQNIIKHARASRASLQLTEHPDSLNVMIEDNGTAVDDDEDDGKGMELLTTRVEYYEGRMLIEGMHGQGTLITIDIPTKHVINQNDKHGYA